TRVRLAHAALLLQRRLGYVNGFSDVVGSPEFTRSLGDRSVLLAHRIVRLGSPPLYVHFAHKPATIGRFASLLAGVPYALSAHAKDIWLTPETELARKVRDARLVLTCIEQGRGELDRLSAGRSGGATYGPGTSARTSSRCRVAGSLTAARMGSRTSYWRRSRTACRS